MLKNHLSFSKTTLKVCDALPNIWEKPAEYQVEQDKFLAAVANLNAKAQTGNLEEIKVAYGEVGASCKACHDTYRRPK